MNDNHTRERQERREAKRRRAGLKCARRLEAAAKALHEYVWACNDCADASAVVRGDDGRTLLIEKCSEYACYLDAIYTKEAA